ARRRPARARVRSDGERGHGHAEGALSALVLRPAHPHAHPAAAERRRGPAHAHGPIPWQYRVPRLRRRRPRASRRADMSTERSLARLGGAAALVGTVLLFGATLLHPLGADPNDAPAAFAEYATDRLWVWTHLGQFLGFALLMAGLAAFGSTFASGAAAAWARIGVIGAAATVAVAAALQAVDGVALKAVVERWAAAAPDAGAVALVTTFPAREAPAHAAGGAAPGGAAD